MRNITSTIDEKYNISTIDEKYNISTIDEKYNISTIDETLERNLRHFTCYLRIIPSRYVLPLDFVVDIDHSSFTVITTGTSTRHFLYQRRQFTYASFVAAVVICVRPGYNYQLQIARSDSDSNAIIHLCGQRWVVDENANP